MQACLLGQFENKLRTDRASNERRQLLFACVDGELRRKVGRKVRAHACVCLCVCMCVCVCVCVCMVWIASDGGESYLTLLRQYLCGCCALPLFTHAQALDMGGNAVVGYRQQFDLEGDSGLVGRAIGTVVTLADIALEDTLRCVCVCVYVCVCV
jgi:hypothetical protein